MRNIINLFEKDIEKAANGDPEAIRRMAHRSALDVKAGRTISSEGLREKLRKRRKELEKSQ